MVNRIIVFIGFVLFLSACQKEKVVLVPIEVEKQYSWVPHEQFQYHYKIRMNSAVDENNLYIIGPDNLSTLSANEFDSTQIETLHYILLFDYPIQLKLPISPRIFVGFEEESITFYPTRNPIGSGMLGFTMQNIDSTFSHFDLPPYWRSESFVFNSLDQCIIPYDYIDQPNGSPPKFAIVSLEVSDLSSPIFDYVDSLNTSTFLLPYNGTNTLYSLHAIDEYFYVSCAGKSFRIAPDLNINTIIDDYFFRIFKHNDVVYGVTQSAMYRSYDNGLSWQLVIYNDVFFQMHFESIGDKLYGYRNSQIWHFDISDDSIMVKEIVNDGLEGNEITSMSLFKGKVYVTSLSGVFTKNNDELLVYKEE